MSSPSKPSSFTLHRGVHSELEGTLPATRGCGFGEQFYKSCLAVSTVFCRDKKAKQLNRELSRQPARALRVDRDFHKTSIPCLKQNDLDPLHTCSSLCRRLFLPTSCWCVVFLKVVDPLNFPCCVFAALHRQECAERGVVKVAPPTVAVLLPRAPRVAAVP